MASHLTTSLSQHLGIVFSAIADQRAMNNMRWTVVGNALYAASQWAIVVVLARYTNPQTVGTLALAFAITAPVMIFFNMQLRAVVATDVRGRYDLQTYFQTRLFTTAAALILILACCVLLHDSAATVLVVILIALSKAAESLSDVIHGYWQLTEHMELVGKSLAVRAVLTLGTFASAIAATHSLSWSSAAFLFGSAAVFLWYDMWQVKRAAKTIGMRLGNLATFFDIRCMNLSAAAAIIRKAAPLGVAAMLISFNSAIPRFFIELYYGKQQLGIFSALSYFIVVGNLLTSAIGQSILPRLASQYASGNGTEFKNTLTCLFVCSIAVAAASMLTTLLFGRRLLLIYGKQYSEAYPVFLLIMAAASIGYSVSILNFSLNAVGAYNIQMPLSLGVSGVLLILCQLTVPTHGTNGAAAALLISSGLQAALSIGVLALKIKRCVQVQCVAQ
jgi:O-antigen/teichoic acid export membrane protein